MIGKPQASRFSAARRRREAGQALVEYVTVLAMFAVLAGLLFVLMAAFSEYGWRMVSLVSMDI